MTISELNAKINEIKLSAERQIKQLRRAYAIENNPHNIGDIITDGATKVKIESISFYQGLDSLLHCKYYGVRLKKNNSQFKNGEKAVIYQVNIQP